MHICTFLKNKKIQSGIKIKNTIIPFEGFNKKIKIPCSLAKMLQENKYDVLKSMSNITPDYISSIPLSEVKYCAPYNNPQKIIGVGLNFSDHARDLEAQQPQQEPASFMKPATAIIGQGDTVKLPAQSSYVTGEAELGVIIGKECKNIAVEDVPDVILGYTTIIDMTAVDILKRNPRFLTRSKSFDTFFSFGPWIITPDEIKNINQIKIETLHNNKQYCFNFVKNMHFLPYQLVSFFSQDMTLKPGDIISCGTPGAVKLHPDDTIGCFIKGIGKLENKVSKY